MANHPEGTDQLIDTWNQRRRDEEARILHDEMIMQSIRRDQRTQSQNGEFCQTPHLNVA